MELKALNFECILQVLIPFTTIILAFTLFLYEFYHKHQVHLIIKLSFRLFHLIYLWVQSLYLAILVATVCTDQLKLCLLLIILALFQDNAFYFHTMLLFDSIIHQEHFGIMDYFLLLAHRQAFTIKFTWSSPQVFSSLPFQGRIIYFLLQGQPSLHFYLAQLVFYLLLTTLIEPDHKLHDYDLVIPTSAFPTRLRIFWVKLFNLHLH